MKTKQRGHMDFSFLAYIGAVVGVLMTSGGGYLLFISLRSILK